MFTDVFIFVVASFVQIIATILSAISFLIPDSLETAISQWMGYLGYLQGVFPVVPTPTMTGLAQTVGVLTVVGWALQLLVAWYLVKLALFTFHLVPFIGKHVEIPGGEKHKK